MKNRMNNKITFMIALFLIFGAVSVIASGVFVSEDGIQANFISEDGSEGLTQNVSYKGGDNETYYFIIKNGLIVETTQDIGGSNETNITNWYNTSWNYRTEITGLTGNISYMEIDKKTNDATNFADTRFISCLDEALVFNHTLEAEIGNVAQFRINNLGENCTYRYYGNSGASTVSSTGNVYFEPIAAYFLDANANDFVGSNDGTNNGASLSSGYINGSYDFDGSTDYISTSAVSTMTSWSVSFWGNPDSLASNQETVSNDRGGWNDDVLIGMNPESQQTAGKWGIVHQESSAQQRTRAQTTTSAQIGRWDFIVITSDGSFLRIYFDGGLQDTTAKAGTDLNFDGAIVNFGRSVQTIRHFNGKIDEILIYDKALTQDQIIQLYTQSAPNFTEGTEESQ